MKKTTKHGNDRKEKKVRKIDKFKLFSSIVKLLLIINICVIIFFKFFSNGITHSATPTIWFYIAIVINIIAIILLFNKNILKKKLLYFAILIVYIVLMVVLPVYKVEGQENVVDESRTTHTNFVGVNYTITYEDVVNYTDYHNFYGLKIKRNTN